MALPNLPPFTNEQTRRSELEMSQAIEDCATRCFEHSNLSDCILECAASLVAGGWSYDDTREVLLGAPTVYRRLANASRRPIV